MAGDPVSIMPTDGAWKDFFEEHLWRAGAPAGKNAEQLYRFLQKEREDGEVYPPREHVFRAFLETPMEKVHVVVLGQDPYHEPGQAHGLCFSVPDGCPLPPSLRNIFKERQTDVGIEAAGASGCLLPWARQGVLLLNTVLTVRRGAAGSHRRHGWEAFTDDVIRALDEREQSMVFVLWGKDARAKRALLHHPDHLILEAEHPSPLSAWRGFFGSAPFSKINAYLTRSGVAPIDWHNEVRS